MKRVFAAMLTAVVALSLTACGGVADDGSGAGQKFDSTKGISADLGCELSDYLFMESKEKMDKFIEDNELQYDEENGDYFNHYISITLDDAGAAIAMATLSNPGNYSMFGIGIGEAFDREIVTNRLNRNGMPLFSDEGNYIYYGASGIKYGAPALAIRLDEDGTIGFVVYTANGVENFTSYDTDTTGDMTAIEIYTAFAESLNDENSGFHGSITDKALTFIENHPDLFVGGDPNGESEDYMSNEAFYYKKYAKSPENYPLTIVGDYELYVSDITETNVSDNMCITEGVLTPYYGYDTGDGGVYYFIMLGSVEVYSGDCVNFTALPIGYGSFENTAGEQTRCVFLAVTSMWQYEAAPDQGYW